MNSCNALESLVKINDGGSFLMELRKKIINKLSTQIIPIQVAPWEKKNGPELKPYICLL